MNKSISNISYNLSINDLNTNGSNVFVNKHIVKGEPGIILFWGDFCHFCHDFIPIFQQLNKKLNNQSILFPCIAIESGELNKNNKISETLNIQGFPTIKFFDQTGKIIDDYNGSRDIDSLLNRICKVYHHCIKNIPHSY